MAPVRDGLEQFPVFNPNPRVVVMGGPVPPDLQTALDGNVELVPEEGLGDAPYAGILVHARAESLPAVRRFRMAGGLLPIYGLAEQPVSVAERILWIREGADDLIPARSCAGVLLRRLRGAATRLQPADEAVPIGVRLDRYLVALHHYSLLRVGVVASLGPGGANRLIEMSFHRDQVMRAADAEVPLDAFGQRRGGDREALAWGLRALDPVDAEGELVNVGPDGVCLLVPYSPNPGDTMRIEIEGLSVSAILDGEVRWRRPMDVGRCEIGLYVNRVVLGGIG